MPLDIELMPELTVLLIDEDTELTDLDIDDDIEPTALWAELTAEVIAPDIELNNPHIRLKTKKLR